MATIYVDASMPDDTGAGTSEGTAKRTPRAAQLAAVAGDKILLKTGYCYAPSSSGAFMFFSNVSNVEIGTYGTASDKPILDGLTYQNPGVTGWSHVSGGIWKKTFGAWYVRRLWVGCRNNGILTTDRYIGTAKRRAWGTGLAEISGNPTAANPSEATILANLNKNMIWFGAGLSLSYALYIYTGSSSIDPPTYYDGIAFIQADGTAVGGVSGIHVQNQTGIYAHDLHFRGNGTAAIRLQVQNSDSRDVADCIFEDCVVTAPWQGAFRSLIAGEASPTHRIKNIIVRRVYCDYLSSADETEYDAAYSNLSGVGDNFCIADGSIGVSVENCTSIDAAHQGLVAGSLAMRTTPPTGCRFINNTISFSSWSGYGRGMSNYDGDTLFRGNSIDGQNTRSQFAGSAKVIGNVWTNMRPSVRKPNVAEWIACESYMQDMFTSGIGNERYLRINPVSVLIANNTVYSPVDPSISFNFFDKSSIGEGDNSFAAGAVTVQNNIIHSPSSTFVRTYEDSTKTIGQQTFSNNCVYDGQTGNNKISWRGTSYAINSAPGCSSNIESHPLLDVDHRLKAGSPCIGVAYPVYPPIRDFGGTYMHKATPDLGAIQSHNPPTRATSRTAAASRSVAANVIAAARRNKRG